MKREYGSYIAEDLLEIKYMGYRFYGIVSDGGKGVRTGVNEVYKFKPHQICLAHVTRNAAKSIGKRSKEERIQELRRLIYDMWKIENEEALYYWYSKVLTWEKRNIQYLRERRYDNTGRKWFVHRGARKAIRLIKKSV